MRILITCSEYHFTSSNPELLHQDEPTLPGHDITHANSHEGAAGLLDEGFDAILMDMYRFHSQSQVHYAVGYPLLFAAAQSPSVKYIGVIGTCRKPKPGIKLYGWAGSAQSNLHTVNQARVGFFETPLKECPGTFCFAPRCRGGRACWDDGSPRKQRYEIGPHFSHFERQKACPLCEQAWSHCMACPECNGTGIGKRVDWGTVLHQLTAPP